MTRTELPFVDEPEVMVDAPAERVWAAVARTIPGPNPSPVVLAFGRALGVEPARSTDRSALGPGAELHGFRVARWSPKREVLLEGRHRFSRYSLRFSLKPLDAARTVVCAETRAEFPGLIGALYRTMVITSGAHRRLVGRMLASIKRRAES